MIFGRTGVKQIVFKFQQTPFGVKSSSVADKPAVAAITLWQGITIEIALAPTAAATARTEFRFSTFSASFTVAYGFTVRGLGQLIHTLF